MRALFDSWPFWALLAAVFAAATALFAKGGVAGVDPDLATLLRTIVVVLVLAPLLAMTGKLSLPRLPTPALAFLALSGLATGASWICYFRALSLGPVSQVAPVDKLSVVLTALFGVIFLGETLSPWGWAGIALIVVGVLLLLIPAAAMGP